MLSNSTPSTPQRLPDAAPCAAAEHQRDEAELDAQIQARRARIYRELDLEELRARVALRA